MVCVVVKRAIITTSRPRSPRWRASASTPRRGARPVLLTLDTTVAALALRHHYFALLDRTAAYVDRILKA
jgi:hypothetical protein